MAGKRSYLDGCAVAHGLDLVGDRWALLVVRELLLGPKRFTDLRNGLPGAAPNVIAQRLRELETAGVVSRRTLGPPAVSKVYELTEWGLELEPVVIALGRWGGRSPAMRHDAPLSVDALVLALRALFNPTAARGLTGRVALRFGLDAFAASVSDGRFHVERADAAETDATVTADADTVNALLWGDLDLDEAIAAGTLRVEGDIALVRRFLTLFPVPTPAG
ncbi:winged helix-turn-helix transcriptional regulator [Spirillospora sp. CA-294931]|uniref:winged helix-turn-helix transcriptional regulator n=1 Tax=Spirillospora sp. CA-294931 TaxID=3240042 RepID=UPI003D8A9444